MQFHHKQQYYDFLEVLFFLLSSSTGGVLGQSVPRPFFTAENAKKIHAECRRETLDESEQR